VPRKAKPKRVKLSSLELDLLNHPPTETTWMCKVDEIPNPGTKLECWVCRTKRPSKPTLVWPIYVAACKKLQIVPGSGRWRPVNSTDALFFDKEKGKWIDAEIPYEGEPSLVSKNLVSKEVTDKAVVA
jgi:hypothetical protein